MVVSAPIFLSSRLVLDLASLLMVENRILEWVVFSTSLVAMTKHSLWVESAPPKASIFFRVLILHYTFTRLV